VGGERGTALDGVLSLDRAGRARGGEWEIAAAQGVATRKFGGGSAVEGTWWDGPLSREHRKGSWIGSKGEEILKGFGQTGMVLVSQVGGGRTG